MSFWISHIEETQTNRKEYWNCWLMQLTFSPKVHGLNLSSKCLTKTFCFYQGFHWKIFSHVPRVRILIDCQCKNNANSFEKDRFSVNSNLHNCGVHLLFSNSSKSCPWKMVGYNTCIRIVRVRKIQKSVMNIDSIELTILRTTDLVCPLRSQWNRLLHTCSGRLVWKTSYFEPCFRILIVRVPRKNYCPCSLVIEFSPYSEGTFSVTFGLFSFIELPINSFAVIDQASLENQLLGKIYQNQKSSKSPKRANNISVFRHSKTC